MFAIRCGHWGVRAMEERGRFGNYAPAGQLGTGEQMPRSERAARRTAVAVKDRMAELGLSTAELSRRSGVSEPVIRDLRNAVDKDYHDRSLSQLSQALGWHHGSIAALLEGRQPEPAPETTGQNRVISLDDLDQARRLFTQALELLQEAVERLERFANG